MLLKLKLRNYWVVNFNINYGLSTFNLLIFVSIIKYLQLNKSNNIRIVQLIDSLEAGGAERMAVSYANALQKSMSFSGLVVTRNEGNLKAQLNDNVSYLFLARKQVIDLKALLTLRKYLKKNKVGFIQAHSTSLFFAFLLKIIMPSIQIIWHDHYGKSEMLKDRKKNILRFISLFLFGIIAVNNKLKAWSELNLFCKKVTYLANFTVDVHSDELITTNLKGIAGKRIVCLANLRPQKDHFLLLEVAQKCKEKYPDWSFHLVGKDFKDSYSNAIRALIHDKKLEENVFLYGSCDDVTSILQQCQIGILTSKSEGLPVALLEYGFQKLGVVLTAVGEIPTVVEDSINGLLVAANDAESFTHSLLKLIKNNEFRITLGAALHATILQTYSEETVLTNYINWINEK